MNRKAKGTNAERDLVHKFWEKGFATVRVAGSGSSRYPSPDLLASNNIRKLAIECKVLNSTKKYFNEKEIDELKEFSIQFGAESWIAVRFESGEWHFITLEDLRKTPSGYMVDTDILRNKGLLLEEVIS